MNILFVCTGNTCRSPMAEYLLKEKSVIILPSVQVRSAGISVYETHPSYYAIRAMEEIGIDISMHRPQLISSELIGWADLILTMATHHQAYLEIYFPRKEVYGLKHFITGNNEDVPDPFGKDMAAYQMTRDDLDEMLEKLIVIMKDRKPN